VFAVPEQEDKHPIDAAMDARRRQLGLRWKDIADEARISEDTLRKIRYGLRDDPARTTDSEARVEDVLGWARGSIQAIRENHPPAVIADGARPPASSIAEYPDWVAGDPFLEYIYDYGGPERAEDQVLNAEKLIATRAVVMHRDASDPRRAIVQKRA
jgi:hypothetical protein